jgi:lipopolysaccharide transport system ATP-binding protein
MSTVISIEHLSKSYRLGAIGGGTLREDFARWMAHLRGQPDPFVNVGSDHKQRLEGQLFWALRDVSFTVKQGEVLGVIGRNGAGKSTLLKILSRVTAPTEGVVKIKGRIASLLEVGTGFHHELTGRENIFLNGAILGMTKAEIRRKLDEIIAFAEIEEFIDTPVKRYSSGMYVRLAFAVAAHLEPEILIVDEVLAVGDAQFQKKCLGKMGQVAAQGRTILFVSHNMAALRDLCTSAILLESGRLQMTGPTGPVILKYMREDTESKPEVRFAPVSHADLQLTAVRLVDAYQHCSNELDVRDAFSIQVDYTVSQPLKGVEFGVRIYNARQVLITTVLSGTEVIQAPGSQLAPGKYRLNIDVPGHFFMPDDYSLSIVAHEYYKRLFAFHEHAIRLRILETGSNVARYGHPEITGIVLNRFCCTNVPLET